jgi:glyoxylase-like metal-dependent hydrolase (beta-lactamase superfamily II)
MKLSEHVHDLMLEMQLPGGVMPLHLSLITDPVQGASLVDTGVPGSLDQLRAALQAEGVKLEDIKRVLVSHHDTDHIGLLADVVRESGAEIWTSASEQPFVQGEQSPQKHPTVPPLKSLSGLRVSRVLHDNEVLDLAGGVRVIATPGHTVGHLSFLVERDGVLIAGDALTSEEGILHGPHPLYSADVPLAMESVQKLSKVPLSSIQTYHGGYVAEQAAEQLTHLLHPETAQ